MTRARALKQVIRARAAKTGERYTTARRHILRELNSPASLASPASPASTKGGLSETKTIEKTGHGLAHWFEILDRYGAIDKGHTAATTLLYEQYNVPGWYCQGIVVAYERARGKRVLNQKCDGSFEVSVSKVVAAKTPALVKALGDAKQRKRWSAKADPGLVKALEAGLKNAKSKGIVTRPDGLVRYRYNWDGMTVQWYLTPKSPGKTLLVATTMKLPGAEAVAPFRAMWKTAIAAIADAVTATPAK